MTEPRPTDAEQLTREQIERIRATFRMFGVGEEQRSRLSVLCDMALASLSETRRTIAPDVDGQDFYELCQQYRHSREMMPHGIPNTVQAFNNLRAYIKTGRLPWPSYQTDAEGSVSGGLPGLPDTGASSPSTLSSESPPSSASLEKP